MNNLPDENKKAPSQDLRVWYCENCRRVHFKTKNVMLDFSEKEFVELTNAILDIFQEHIDPLEIDRLADLVSSSDEVLLGETIS